MFRELIELIEANKKQGFILRSEFFAIAPEGMENEQLDRIMQMIEDMGMEIRTK